MTAGGVCIYEYMGQERKKWTDKLKVVIYYIIHNLLVIGNIRFAAYIHPWLEFVNPL